MFWLCLGIKQLVVQIRVLDYVSVSIVSYIIVWRSFSITTFPSYATEWECGRLYIGTVHVVQNELRDALLTAPKIPYRFNLYSIIFPIVARFDLDRNESRSVDETVSQL